MCRRTAFLLIFASVYWLPPVAISRAADSWPEWRGPNGQGTSTAVDVPTEWSESKNVAWRTELSGRGWSTPVVADGRIWVTTAIDKPNSKEDADRRRETATNSQPMIFSESVSLLVIEFDLVTGKQLRAIEVMNRKLPQPIHVDNSYATPTPIIEDGRLYCHYGPNGCAAVDTRSGKVLWSNRDIEVQHENGAGSSPVLWNDLLFIHCDGIDQQFIVAIDKDTGEIAWKTRRSGELNSNVQLQKSYATPLVIEAGGRAELISPAADWVYGYEPETGRELWRVKYGALGFSNSARPVFGHNMLYLCTGFMKAQLLAIHHDGSDQPSISWKHTKQIPNVACPVLVGDELYFASDNGVATCLDAKSGDVHWTKRIGKRFWASPVYADGHIYFFDRAGTTTVVAASTDFRHIADNELDESIYASAAIVDGRIVLRTDKALYAIVNDRDQTE